MTTAEEMLELVANDLAWLSNQPIFVGGATVGLYLDAFGRSHLRPTVDVDCVLPRVAATTAAWWQFEARLRQHGWTPDPAGPICRYTSPSGVTVDLMPEDTTVLGFASGWYQAGVREAVEQRLPSGRVIRAFAVEYLLATKLDAFDDRGRRDPWASKDLEDVVALLDGCGSLLSRVAGAEPALRAAIARGIVEILDDEVTREVALAQLPPGGDVIARERHLLQTMEALRHG